jgi:hypothetical protein
MKSPKGSQVLDARGDRITAPAPQAAGELSRVEKLIRDAESASRSGDDDKARECLSAVFETLSAFQMNRRPANLDADSGSAAGYRIARSA